MSTRLLENIVEFTIPSDFADRLFPERSPALRNGRGEHALQYEYGMETCMTFIRTMENGWKLRDTTNPRQRVSMSARDLRNRLGRKYDQYLDFQQQDAHEFLRHLLDCMYMEELDVIKKRQPPPPKRSREQSTLNLPPAPIPESQRLVPFVDQVFGGQLASMLICSSCKHVSHTYEPFMDLSLSIRSKQDTESKRNRLKAFAQRFTRQAGLGANGSPNGDSITAAAASWLRLGPTHGPSLQHCLRQFTAVESLEGDNMVGCSRCWKLANPTYVSKRKRRSSQSSSSSSSDGSDSDEDCLTRESQASSSVSAQNPGLGTKANLGAIPRTTDTLSIPSISTTSPDGTSQSSMANGHTQASSSATSSTYLTPASSRHGSIRRTRTSSNGDSDSVSTTSMSDVSGVSLPVRAKEVRLKTPNIPKSQRVLLRRAYKRYLIAVPPPVLVIHLKRFQQVSRTPVALFGSLKKIDDFIAFPEYLDLKPFIAPRREEFGLRPAKIKDYKGAYDEQVMYRLYAVVVHIGNMVMSKYLS
ncbi:hypothetical protein FRC17_001585 [Serendipita sp. 399]|nr:hypothetical protein FRC17_001585 [Serendipita sp. 399]